MSAWNSSRGIVRNLYRGVDRAGVFEVPVVFCVRWPVFWIWNCNNCFLSSVISNSSWALLVFYCSNSCATHLSYVFLVKVVQNREWLKVQVTVANILLINLLSCGPLVQNVVNGVDGTVQQFLCCRLQLRSGRCFLSRDLESGNSHRNVPDIANSALIYRLTVLYRDHKYICRKLVKVSFSKHSKRISSQVTLFLLVSFT